MPQEEQYTTDPAIPTKRTVRDVGNFGYSENTFESLCSVEIGETAKGELTVKSVKVYGRTAEEAGTQALAEFRRLKETLA